ncbi:MAG: helix-turn-helix transcriptional regulator [Pseudomonas sp.]
MTNVPRRIMRLKEVMHVCGLGRSSIYNYIAAGKFPESRKLGGGRVCWDSSEIQCWVDAVLDGREWKASVNEPASRK